MALPLLAKDKLLDEEDAALQDMKDEIDALEEKLEEGHIDKVDYEEEGKPATKRLQVISLHSIPVAHRCDRIVARFVKSKTKRLVSFLLYTFDYISSTSLRYFVWQI